MWKGVIVLVFVFITMNTHAQGSFGQCSCTILTSSSTSSGVRKFGDFGSVQNCKEGENLCQKHCQAASLRNGVNPNLPTTQVFYRWMCKDNNDPFNPEGETVFQFDSGQIKIESPTSPSQRQITPQNQIKFYIPLSVSNQEKIIHVGKAITLAGVITGGAYAMIKGLAQAILNTATLEYCPVILITPPNLQTPDLINPPQRCILKTPNTKKEMTCARIAKEGLVCSVRS